GGARPALGDDDEVESLVDGVDDAEVARVGCGHVARDDRGDGDAAVVDEDRRNLEFRRRAVGSDLQRNCARALDSCERDLRDLRARGVASAEFGRGVARAGAAVRAARGKGCYETKRDTGRDDSTAASAVLCADIHDVFLSIEINHVFVGQYYDLSRGSSGIIRAPLASSIDAVRVENTTSGVRDSCSRTRYCTRALVRRRLSVAVAQVL